MAQKHTYNQRTRYLQSKQKNENTNNRNREKEKIYIKLINT